MPTILKPNGDYAEKTVPQRTETRSLVRYAIANSTLKDVISSITSITRLIAN